MKYYYRQFLMKNASTFCKSARNAMKQQVAIYFRAWSSSLLIHTRTNNTISRKYFESKKKHISTRPLSQEGLAETINCYLLVRSRNIYLSLFLYYQHTIRMQSFFITPPGNRVTGPIHYLIYAHAQWRAFSKLDDILEPR